jgi:lipopolysaccharide/colanic/teichoic acid biosynthesis glycosyltransferase
MHINMVLSSYVNSQRKRVFDLLLCFTILIPVIFLLFFIWVLYYFIGERNFLFKQLRVGKNGSQFVSYKIRTLKYNPDYNDLISENISYLHDKDSFVKYFGKYLRKTRIDEIPQLYNVLIGEMSIVGPRPERPIYVNKFKEEILEYELRLLVKPGITGLAQIYNPDANFYDVEEKLKNDVSYIQKASMMQDVLIILKSFIIIIK